jgi:hypothetical protein
MIVTIIAEGNVHLSDAVLIIQVDPPMRDNKSHDVTKPCVRGANP